MTPQKFFAMHALLPWIVGSLLSPLLVLVSGLFLKSSLGTYIEERIKAVHAWELETYRAEAAKERSRLDAWLGNRTYVTQAHFDVELAAMKELFDLLSHGVLAISAVRPMIDEVPPNETDDERQLRFGRRVRALEESYNTLLARSEALFPFVPIAVYDQISEALISMRTERSQVTFGWENSRLFSWYNEGPKNVGTCKAARDSAAKAIRGRVESLSILDK